MANALIRKIEGYGPLSDTDREWLVAATSKPKRVEPNTDLACEATKPEEVNVILEGFAFRYKSTPDGTRQIFAFLVPGDFCDLHVALLDSMDHSIATLTSCSVAKIPRSAVLDLTQNRPSLTRAFWWCSLVDAAVLREWIVNVGSRQAPERIAHLFCELHVRLKAVGLTTGNTFVLPVNQTELADTVGISTVHVNRSLRDLRELGLVTFRGELVEAEDMERLKVYAGFNPNYLHLTRRSPQSS